MLALWQVSSNPVKSCYVCNHQIRSNGMECLKVKNLVRDIQMIEIYMLNKPIIKQQTPII